MHSAVGILRLQAGEDVNALTEHDEGAAGRQFRVPALLLVGREWVAFDRLATEKLHRREIPWMRDVLGRSQGCFAVASSSVGEIVSTLGSGRLIYADRA